MVASVVAVVAVVAGTAAASCANWQVLPLEQNPRAKKRHVVEGGWSDGGPPRERKGSLALMIRAVWASEGFGAWEEKKVPATST